jgi:hypothetical protein
VRVLILSRSGTPSGTALASVAIERANGRCGIGLMITACVPVVWHSLPELQRIILLSTGPMLVAIARGSRIVDQCRTAGSPLVG